MRDFRDLKVWEKAYRLTLDVYKVTRKFPKEELYGLTSQIRRAAASIPANLAEGCGRAGTAELGRFVQRSRTHRGYLCNLCRATSHAVCPASCTLPSAPRVTSRAALRSS